MRITTRKVAVERYEEKLIEQRPPEPPALPPLTVLLNVPEICGVALPGESVMDGFYKVPEGAQEVCVQFWPLLVNNPGTDVAKQHGMKPGWGLTLPVAFRIRTEERLAGDQSHHSEIVKAYDPNTGHPYISSLGICGGTMQGKFTIEPISCALAIRTWYGESMGHSVHRVMPSALPWWKKNAEAFFSAYPFAKCVLAPSIEPAVDSGVYPLTRDMVEAYVNGKVTEYWKP